MFYFLFDETAWGIIADVVALLTFLGMVGRSSYKSLKGRRQKRQLRKSSLATAYGFDELFNYTNTYIKPDCMEESPSHRDRDDPTYKEPTRYDLFDRIDRFLLPDKKKKPSERGDWGLFVLADSGMGKTAFVVNYTERYKRHRDHPIAVIRMGNKLTALDAVDQMDQLEDKEKTVLFLDGFDEDSKARNDYRSRFEELITKALPFRRVIITCRTQFFVSQDHFPDLHARIKRNQGGDIKKLYLAPFTEKQEISFLESLYPFWHYGFSYRSLGYQSKEWKTGQGTSPERPGYLCQTDASFLYTRYTRW